MNFELKPLSGHPNEFVLSGAMEIKTINPVVAAGKYAIEQANAAELIFDCKGVIASDSSGIATLVAWTRHAKNYNKKLILKALPQFMLDIINVSWLKPVLNISEE